VDDEHGDGVASLQFAQVGESGATSPEAFSSMRCRRKNGSRMSRRGGSSATISARSLRVEIDIEPHGRCGDHLDIELGEPEACGGADGNTRRRCRGRSPS
jgi:hypothetical protein